jgi:hypothetical protein
MTTDDEFEGNIPLTPAELEQLARLWTRAKTLIDDRKWVWQRAAGGDSDALDGDFGYDFEADQATLYGPQSRTRRDWDNRDDTYYTGEAIEFSLPTELLSLSDEEFARRCDRVESERLAVEAESARLNKAAAEKAAVEKMAKEAAARERAELAEFQRLAAKYGETPKL